MIDTHVIQVNLKPLDSDNDPINTVKSVASKAFIRTIRLSHSVSQSLGGSKFGVPHRQAG